MVCEIRAGLIEDFPVDPSDLEEVGNHDIRAFDWTISIDGQRSQTSRLFVAR
jgi:hypothetical protein